MTTNLVISCRNIPSPIAIRNAIGDHRVPAVFSQPAKASDFNGSDNSCQRWLSNYRRISPIEGPMLACPPNSTSKELSRGGRCIAHLWNVCVCSMQAKRPKRSAPLIAIHHSPIALKSLLMPLFLMGCFPGDFRERKRPIKAKSAKRPIKVGRRPIKEGKWPIEAMVLVGISVGCLMGCFLAPPPWQKTATLKRPIKGSMMLSFLQGYRPTASNHIIAYNVGTGHYEYDLVV